MVPWTLGPHVAPSRRQRLAARHPRRVASPAVREWDKTHAVWFGLRKVLEPCLCVMAPSEQWSTDLQSARNPVRHTPFSPLRWYRYPIESSVDPRPIWSASCATSPGGCRSSPSVMSQRVRAGGEAGTLPIGTMSIGSEMLATCHSLALLHYLVSRLSFP